MDFYSLHFISILVLKLCNAGVDKRGFDGWLAIESGSFGISSKGRSYEGVTGTSVSTVSITMDVIIAVTSASVAVIIVKYMLHCKSRRTKRRSSTLR